MIKEKVIVPRGIRFMSEWTDFGLPDYPCILDKQIPGCGFTEYCICNKENLILCSPRKLLLENKEDQHRGEVFYVRFELDQDETIDKDLEKPLNRGSGRVPTKAYDLLTPDEIKRILDDLEKSLDSYVTYCLTNEKPIKILVTYDSFRIVKEFLDKKSLSSTFRIIIDEFQSIFTDSRFKASSELEFVGHLQSFQKVCFVSATPMIDKYLEQIDEFKDLPYYKLDWISSDPFRVLKPKLKTLSCRSINTTAYPIIDSYLKGDFEGTINSFGQFVQSREAVFYVNSVTNILSIVRKSNLTPEQCNILIARTPDNIRKLKRRLGNKWEIGSIPKKGEPHKMFTFCTRTVYLGVDFYSTNARTFIFSDANIDTLAVDISLDLPQILGRQRNDDNPWKNSATFYYRTNCTEIDESDFEKKLQSKLKITKDLLDVYANAQESAKNSLAGTYLRDTNSSNYKYHYCAVNRHSGNVLVPTLNRLVLLAEQRCFEIQQYDYEDRFSVFNSIYQANLIQDSSRTRIMKAVEDINNLNDMRSKMKYLCSESFTKEELSFVLDQVPKKCKELYQVLGPDRCKSLGYNISRMYSELNLLISTGSLSNKSDLLKDAIYDNFKIGEVVLLKEVKDRLKGIYDSIGYPKTPVASDLKNYFELERARIKQSSAVRIKNKL